MPGPPWRTTRGRFELLNEPNTVYHVLQGCSMLGIAKSSVPSVVSIGGIPGTHSLRFNGGPDVYDVTEQLHNWLVFKITAAPRMPEREGTVVARSQLHSFISANIWHRLRKGTRDPQLRTVSEEWQGDIKSARAVRSNC